jgi:hypothetical protein
MTTRSLLPKVQARLLERRECTFHIVASLKSEERCSSYIIFSVRSDFYIHYLKITFLINYFSNSLCNHQSETQKKHFFLPYLKQTFFDDSFMQLVKEIPKS